VQGADACEGMGALPQVVVPISLDRTAADFGIFLHGSDDMVEHLHFLLTHTLRKELPWLSTKAQAQVLGIMLLLPHIQEVHHSNSSSFIL
jgi:hypothetical protein